MQNLELLSGPERFPMTGCAPGGLIIPNGHPLDCCGCPLTIVGDTGSGWRVCSCRCHQSARMIAGLPAQP